MKKSFNILIVSALSALPFVACSDWNEPEALNYEIDGIAGTNHGEAYYANLREYKRSKHTIAFGWYSDWTGTGTQMTPQLMGMPDSVDIVSMWGNWHSLSPEKKEDLRKVQQIKGTKVMMCFIIDDIGAQTTPPQVKESWIVDGVKYNSREEACAAFWGWYQSTVIGNNGPHYGDSSPEGIEKAIRKYARSLLDTIRKYNWDGFDFDLEPNFGHGGNIANFPDRIGIVLDELSKELGPKSGTGKLLCVDGEPHKINKADGEKLDYFLLQAYGDANCSFIDSRINQLFRNFEPLMSREEIVSKTVLCANFESYGSTGGGNFTTRDGVHTSKIVGYAGYSYPGVDAPIGGFGAFRMGFDPNYRFMRQAIGVANPVIK